MKISTNPIGNYSINTVKKFKPAAETKKIDGSGIDINKKERKFFAQMFPADKEKVMSYHFYNKKGKFGGVAIGNNIDMRG